MSIAACHRESFYCYVVLFCFKKTSILFYPRLSNLRFLVHPSSVRHGFHLIEWASSQIRYLQVTSTNFMLPLHYHILSGGYHYKSVFMTGLFTFLPWQHVEYPSVLITLAHREGVKALLGTSSTSSYSMICVGLLPSAMGPYFILVSFFREQPIFLAAAWVVWDPFQFNYM